MAISDSLLTNLAILLNDLNNPFVTYTRAPGRNPLIGVGAVQIIALPRLEFHLSVLCKFGNPLIPYAGMPGCNPRATE
uniref:Uncharacterized protein n=1 Tax=Candidatus Kentrum sp. UNK TaxID=2126344 RepID=A0A451AWS7_9GAMM|nr:MAG: hypothetical protein BECKUNK1418G_GA0071005_102421 [Candidatus Kentron sp. UNK]VFK70514.1 MAG: hypothetical protein BECKUNK1418H_GA0071006_103021 [Candidatus Kentron sp. UNK]